MSQYAGQPMNEAETRAQLKIFFSAPLRLCARTFFGILPTAPRAGRPRYHRVEGDGSSLKKARKFGPLFRNDFPDLLAKWPARATAEGRAWQVPAEKIAANGYNMT